MTTPHRDEFRDVLDLVAREAQSYVASVDDRPVLNRGAEAAAKAFDIPLPDDGIGASAALRELLHDGGPAVSATSGPRCYHFVIGGATPASLAADILASTYDQIAYTWVSSPLAVRLELVCLEWLKELFELSPGMSGIMTTGATMANFVSLAAARQWWGEQHGVDVSEAGMSSLPPVPVFSSGHIHASALKCFSLLGIGRQNVHPLSADPLGTLDLEALEQSLRDMKGKPSIVVANAGEVNAGHFDPIEAMADLAEEHNAWLHVDGAFGLFARLSERTHFLTRGTRRARSVTVDGHKWLNVPYDCGFAFVDDRQLLAKAFAYAAAYLPAENDPRPTLGAIGPESSRRARSFSVWSTLRAYGRNGYRSMVEKHLDLAQYLAHRVDDAPELERLAKVRLNIVCFRFNPGGVDEARLNDLNTRLGEAILADGRVLAGSTDFGGKVALRPAISNWRTREKDLDFFVAVVRELAGSLR